ELKGNSVYQEPLSKNGIAERKNRTLIEAARIMLADLLLPILFWAETVNTACYVQNRVLVTKPHNKTLYELLHGRTPSIGFMRPFGCLVTILNILDPLGKFKGKVDEGFLVGYSIVGNKMHKAFPLPRECSHWQYKFPLLVEGGPTARRMEIPLPRVCTAMMKKLPKILILVINNSLTLDVSKDQFEKFSDSNDDSTSIDDNYLSIDNIDYVEASPPDSELVSLEEVKDDNLREKLLNINLLIAKIKSLNDNPTPDHVLKPLSLFSIPVEDSNSFLDKSDTSFSYLDNSLPEFETFSNHTKETISGSTTTHVDCSLSKYDSFLFKIEPDQGELTKSEIFYFDIKEKNSGSTTIHANISLPDLECFNFKREPEPGKLTSIVDSGIHENVLSATNVNLPPEDDHFPLFAYVVWIFLFFLTYPVVSPNFLSFGNEDTIFDPGISNYHISSFMSGVSHRSGTFMKFNVYPNHLNESPMEILPSTTFPKDQ
nr:retrovirus-related Pol polyprotein from transposon TNT 1-94 [Tanacetum cinerariifolium]